MTTPYNLKSTKKFNAPALFVNPQSIMDAESIRKTISDYPSDSSHIEGIVVSMKDWEPVKTELLQSSLFNSEEINKKIRIIDHTLHTLFQGYSTDKTVLMNVELDKRKLGDYQLISGGLRLRDVLSTISALDKTKTKEKADRFVKDVYPYMDILVNPIMKYSIENNSDIVISASVPVTSSILISQQTTQIRKMHKASKILADTLFAKEMEKRDLMFLLTANMSIIKPENYDDLINTLVIRDEKTNEIIVPDQLGIRLVNEDENNTDAIQSFLDFIARLAKTLQNHKKDIPIHVFNVREFGYVTFSYGATTITSPIATPSSIKRSNSSGVVSDMGKYYHPIHMLDYRYEKLLALARSVEYILPCHCKICQKEKNLIKAKERWNKFRREHFLLAKHLEMQEVKEAPANVLNRHLQQKFSRSKKTVWLAFLDQQPILTFN